MVCKTTSIKRHAAGLTLVEMLVAMMVAGVLIASAGALWFYSNRSFAAQLNYVDMDQASQIALDTLSKQMRQTKKLLFAESDTSSSKVVFTDYDDEPLTFQWLKRDKALYRIKGGQTNTLLTSCSELDFSIFQRNPVAGSYDQYPAGDASNCKLIHVQWVCSRPVFGTGQDNTECISSAKIVLRNP